MTLLSRAPMCLLEVLFVWPFIFPSINCRFPSVHQSSVSQRPGHSPLSLVPESLQEPLSRQLGEFPPNRTGVQWGSCCDWPLCLKRVCQLFTLRFQSFGFFSLHLQQVQKWDEQLEAGSFPGKIWTTFRSVVIFVILSVSSFCYDVK